MEENKKPVTSYKVWKRICLSCIFLTTSAFLCFLITYSASACRGSFDVFFSLFLANLPFILPILLFGIVFLFVGKLKSKTGKRLLSVLFALCFIAEVCALGILIMGSFGTHLRPIGIFVVLAYLVMIFSFMKYIKALDKSNTKEPALSGRAFSRLLLVLCLLVAAWVFIMMNL